MKRHEQRKAEISAPLPTKVRAIVVQEAARQQISVKCVLSGRRWPAAVEARRQISFRLRDMGYSLTRIGLFLGGMDHSSIVHMLKRKSATERRREALAAWEQSRSYEDYSGEWI